MEEEEEGRWTSGEVYQGLGESGSSIQSVASRRQELRPGTRSPGE